MASAQRVEATMQSSTSEALLWPSDPTLQIIVATSFCKFLALNLSRQIQQ